jgi:hypothetical protein
MAVTRVFKTVEEAICHRPADDDKGRFRLYEVTQPAGPEQTRYVWERNPDTAIGRGARDMGVTAEVYGPSLSPDEALAALLKLPAAERRRLMEAIKRAESELDS